LLQDVVEGFAATRPKTREPNVTGRGSTREHFDHRQDGSLNAFKNYEKRKFVLLRTGLAMSSVSCEYEFAL